MAKFVKQIALLLWVLTLCVSFLGVTASAAAAPVSATIELNTALSGDLPDTPDTFTLRLAPDKAGFPMPEGSKDGVYTAALKGEDSHRVQISFDRVGVYGYTVTQLPGTNEDCYQDSRVYHITAYVTSDNRDQSLHLSVLVTREGSEEKQEKIIFSNRYGSAAEVVLGAVKTLDKKTPKDGQFSFRLKDGQGQVLQTVKNSGRNVEFDPISYHSAGTYTYTISEVVGKDGGIVYDRSVFTAEVTVEKDADGNYQATVLYKLADKALEGKPVFANKTKSGTPQTGDNANLGFWIGALVISAAGLVGIWYYDKRRKKPEDPEEFFEIKE